MSFKRNCFFIDRLCPIVFHSTVLLRCLLRFTLSLNPQTPRPHNMKSNPSDPHSDCEMFRVSNVCRLKKRDFQDLDLREHRFAGIRSTSVWLSPRALKQTVSDSAKFRGGAHPPQFQTTRVTVKLRAPTDLPRGVEDVSGKHSTPSPRVPIFASKQNRTPCGQWTADGFQSLHFKQFFNSDSIAGNASTRFVLTIPAGLVCRSAEFRQRLCCVASRLCISQYAMACGQNVN